MARTVRHPRLSTAMDIGMTRRATAEGLLARSVGNAACPAGAPGRANTPRPCPPLFTLVVFLPVALIEFLTAGTPLGPPPRATHFFVMMLVSAIRGGRRAAMRETPTLAAVLAVAGMTFRTVMRRGPMARRPLPRGSGTTRRRTARSQFGWSRRSGSTCRRRASWAAGSCVQRLCRSSACTAAAAWGTIPPLPR